MVLLGAGKGLFSSPSRALLSSLFVDRRGRALGLYSSGTDIGGLLAACLAFIAVGGGARMLTGADWAAPLRTLGWRSPFVPVTLALIATTGLYWTWSREMLTIRRPTAGILATVRRLVTTREQREALFAFGLFFFTINAWINFLPTYLTEAKGLAPPLPQVLFAVVFIAGAGIKPAAGAVSDRVPRRLVAVTGLLLAVVALGAVTVVNSPGALAMAIGIFATGYKSQFPLVDALIMDAAPSDNTGGDIGAARAIFLGAGALGPVYMGVVATVADYETAIAGLAVGLLLSAGVLALSLRR
jgi:MFS family permease